jgi:uncharacterized glyoxalase superfamily protein PhnB
VPALEPAVTFYTRAFGLSVARRFGHQGAELAGWPVPLFLLEKAPGSLAAPGQHRSYARHWTPVHIDVVVDEVDAAVARAVEAGAIVEQPVTTAVWGKIAVLADPFGHGLCIIEFLNRGYDEVAN